MKELKCRVVMLPANKKMIDPGDLCIHNGPSHEKIGSTLIIAKQGTKNLDEELNREAVSLGWYVPQHLYITGNLPITEGDYVLYNKSVVKVAKVWEDGTYEVSDEFTTWLMTDSCSTYNIKVVATTDSSLNLPSIPYPFLEQYVNTNGSIREVNIEMEEQVVRFTSYDSYGDVEMMKGTGRYVPKITNNEIVIANPINKEEDWSDIMDRVMKTPSLYNNGLSNLFKWFHDNYLPPTHK